MRPIEFEILLALAPGDRHGYAIIQDLEARSGTAEAVETGTLYRALQRLVDDGLIRSVEPPPAAGDPDERRRYYRITPRGRVAAAGEARRMAGLLRRARAAKLLSGGA